MYTEFVKEFTERVSQPVLMPEALSEAQVAFIDEMVRDELEELRDADGMVEQSDAFADIIYYLLDTAVRQGWPMDQIFVAVHQANMRKITDGVNQREDGKVLKPDGWYGPEDDIEEIFEELGR